MSGWRDRRRAEIEGFTYLARQIATLDRWPKDKYLPSMESLLGQPEKPKRQSPADMLAAFQDMQAAGAPITIKRVG